MFLSILENAASILSIRNAFICTGFSVICGIIISLCHSLTGKSNKNFSIALVVLPALVQTVIMMVNGNLGTGVAIVGAFSLIRFRSIPGTSREIVSVFFAMVIGLATGMGYITYALFITVFVGIVMVILGLVPWKKVDENKQTLKITIYEDMDYTCIFDDIFEKYLKSVETDNVKTTNMGSMYQISYIIEQKDKKNEKEMIDEIRCRNGNLTVSCGRIVNQIEQL